MSGIRILTLWGSLLAALPLPLHALPPWARRYNMNCSGCHSPAVPRLNATGIAFKWAGYRMPDDIGVSVDVKKVENYLAARVIGAYDRVARKNEAREADGISIPSASFFAAGPLGKRYGAYLEFERTPDAAIDLIGSISGIWGKESRYGGFRLAQGHLLFAAGGVAGFDRATAIFTPLAYDESVTERIPLRLGGDQTGAEVFTVLGGRNRVALQVLNGLVVGSGEGGAAVSKRDVVLTNQFIWDDAGSGLGLAAYAGNALGVVPQQSDVSTRYYRLAVTANKILQRFEVLGGYVMGRDRYKSSGVSEARSDPVSGDAWWLQAQYTINKLPLTLLSRYEYLNRDRAIRDLGRTRVAVGAVFPLNVPEYLRWSIELYRDQIQSDAQARRTGLATRLQVAY